MPSLTVFVTLSPFELCRTISFSAAAERFGGEWSGRKIMSMRGISPRSAWRIVGPVHVPQPQTRGVDER